MLTTTLDLHFRLGQVQGFYLYTLKQGPGPRVDNWSWGRGCGTLSKVRFHSSRPLELCFKAKVWALLHFFATGWKHLSLDALVRAAVMLSFLPSAMHLFCTILEAGTVTSQGLLGFRDSD